MSKTLEELGYEKSEYREYVTFDGKHNKIVFDSHKREFIALVDECDANYINMEELKAIYKYCEDNKWI